MSKNLKKKILQMNLLLVCTSLIFSGCKKDKRLENDESKESKKIEFVNKETKYKKDNTTDVLIDDDHIKKEDIVKIIKHGDHWHVFTKDGKEHITYRDPETITDDDDFSLVSVVSANMLKSLDVVKILKHGDHYHVYTSSGMEYLTYENPSSIFPNIPIGTYVGSHGDNRRSHDASDYSYAVASDNQSNSANNITSKSIDEDEVVKILKHADHYHIYTRSGKEYISYKDPSRKYPNIPIGTYVGTHESNRKKEIEKEIENINNQTNPDYSYDRFKKLKDSLSIVNVLGKGEVDRYDIVKILKHEDHYHIYDSKGNEGITYTDPRLIYPNATFGIYNGSHGTSQSENPSRKEFNWPKGVTKILDHGDHWHLYRGNTEVAVVHENPKSHYPNAEYIVEHHNHSEQQVTEGEIFSYDSVKAYLKEGIFDVLDDNLKKMTNYGSLTNTNIPVYGSDEIKENIFYWLHNGDHYHAITIKQIIQNAKAGDYKNYTAKEVVSALKYIIQNPEKIKQLQKENEEKITVDQEKIINFLKDYYKMDVQVIGDKAYIYAKETYEFLLKDFKEENKKVKYTKELPKIEKENNTEENEEDKTKKEVKESKTKQSINKSDENIKKLMKILHLTKEQVEEKVLKTDGLSLTNAVVKDDGTIICNEKTYILK